jgi:hypothetical protein
MSILRVTYWKWLCSVQLLASKGYIIEFMLAGCKYGKTLHDFCLYSFHMQTLQAVQPTDNTACIEFFHWLLGNQQLHVNILFTNEATVIGDRITNAWGSHI